MRLKRAAARVDNEFVDPAASAVAPAESSPTRRRPQRGTSRRIALQLFAGLLVVAGIPVLATAHILDANALRSAQARADAALRAEVENAQSTLGRLSQDASNRADDLSRDSAVQRALLTGDRTALRRLARQEAGVVYYLQGERVAGQNRPNALTKAVSLVLNGKQIGVVVATVPLDERLAARLTRSIGRSAGDKLVFVRRNKVVGSSNQFALEGSTTRMASTRYRASVARVQNTPGVTLAAVRPDHAVTASVASYRDRVRYAAAGSLALLVLVGLLFGGPIVRSLSDLRRMASQAATDALTGLANRRSFDEELALEWRRAERVGDPLALILADLDDFKRANDTYGHQAGDEALRKLGEVFTAGVRQVDLAARYGGEEFAVIVPETDLGGAQKMAERLRVALGTTDVELADGRRFQVTASFGVAVKGDLTHAEDLVAAADEALYEAKRAGKNRISPELQPAPGAQSGTAPERRRRPAAAKKPAAALSKTAEPKPSTRNTRSGPANRPAESEI